MTEAGEKPVDLAKEGLPTVVEAPGVPVPIIEQMPPTPSETTELGKPAELPTEEQPLRQDGPTLEEYVARGYSPENYPPQGYAPRMSISAPTNEVAKMDNAVFFKKVLVQTPFFVKGQRVNFEVIGDNLGVIKLTPGQDDAVIEVLAKAARANGGRGSMHIAALDEAGYLDLKKNHPYRPPVPRPQQRLKVWDPNPRKKAASPVVKGDDSPPPARVGQVAPTASNMGRFTPNTGAKNMPKTRLPSTGQLRADVIPQMPE